MPVTAAELIARVSTVGVDAAEAQLMRMSGTTDKAGAAFANLGALAAGAAVVGIVALGVKSVEMAGNFQQSVNRLRTGAGDTQDSFKTLASGILGVSMATGQMTGPLTTAMYEILSSGQRGAQAFSTLSAAAKGAVIEQAKVEDVANTLSGVMTNYGTKVYGASNYMNGLITAVSRGKVTLQDLSTAMGPIDPVAHAIGISFSDLAAAMSTQTNAMIPAARAATGLRFMMQSLEDPTHKANAAMTKWGLDSVKVADEMKVSLPGALQMIYNAAKKAGPEGSVPFDRAISDMVGGQRSLSTFMALTGGHMKDFVANAAAVAASMKTGGGEVDGWALAQSNFNVQMDRAKASVAAVAIQFGLALLPALTNLAGLVPNLVGYFSNFSQHAGTLVPILAGIGAVLVAVLVPAVWSLAAGVLAATWPVLLIGAAVAGLVAIFMHLYQTSAPFKSFIDNLVVGLHQLWQWIQANVIPALQRFGQMAMQVGGWLIANLVPAVMAVATWVRTGLWPVLVQIGQFLAATFMPVWQQLVQVWQGQIMPALRQLWAALQPLAPVLQVIGGIILAVVVVALGLLVGILAGVIKGLAGFLSGLAVVIGGVIQIFSGVIQIISGIVRFIYDLLTGNFKNLGNDLHTIWQGIVTMFTGIWNVIKGIFIAAWGAISGLVSGFVQGIIGFFTTLYNALVGHSIVPNMINGIITWFASLPGRVGAFVSNLVLTVINFFLRLAQQAISSAQNLVSGVINQIAQLPGRAGGWIANMAGTILGGLSKLAGQAVSAGANIVSSIASGITGNIVNFLGNAMGAVGDFISQHLPKSPAKMGPLRDLPLQAAMITQQIAEGIAAGNPKIQAAMGNLLKPVTVSMAPGAGTLPRYSFPSTTAPAITVYVQSPDMIMDGVRVSRQILPHLKNALVYNT
jgi:TP901 family phage tail tape measure protein